MNNNTLKNLNQAILSKNLVMVGFLAMRIPRDSITKETLSLAIASEDRWIAKIVAERSLEKNFDRPILNQALSSKEPRIIQIILKKTPSRFFGSDVLKSALRTKNLEIVKIALDKTPLHLLQKENLKESLKTENQDIYKEFASKSDPKFFDTEIMEMSLQTKNPDIVRTTVNYTGHKDVLLQFKDRISSAILDVKDIQNFAAQILSRSDNRSLDVEMQETVLDIYMDVILKHFKKGTIPKDFPMKSFERSIQESRYFFAYPQGIHLDSLKEKNRFLILPIYSYGHAFSAIVRKTEDESKYSITFINLGARPFEMSGRGNSYKEYIYSKENALKVLKDHSYNVRLHYPQKAVQTAAAYKNFKSASLEEYTLNVVSRDQKTGNCFLKNIEKGMRYALSIGLSKVQEPDFSEASLRVTSQSGQKLKVKFLRPISKPNEENTGLSTLELRKQLIEALEERFPMYQNEIRKEWDIYQKRKETTKHKIPFLPKIRPMKTWEDSPVFENHSQMFFLQTKPDDPQKTLRPRGHGTLTM
jgi:hypothetical protein